MVGRVRGPGAGMMVAVVPSSISWKVPGLFEVPGLTSQHRSPGQWAQGHGKFLLEVWGQAQNLLVGFSLEAFQSFSHIVRWKWRALQQLSWGRTVSNKDTSALGLGSWVMTFFRVMSRVTTRRLGYGGSLGATDIYLHLQKTCLKK